ncbi:MAG: hypothetical protein HYS05_11940 [Acidobacteria bacterium]|nr:hypothetical protein [Acidobacteriota bacterium]
MAHRGVRIALFWIAAALMAGTGYRLFTLERRIAASTEESRQFDLQAQETVRQLAEVKSAQSGYVAAGQGHAYWTTRVSTLVRAVNTGLDALSQRAIDEASSAVVADARKSIDQFVKLDARAREYVTASQLLMASDVIFADGLELVASAASQLDQAREHIRQEHQRSTADIRRLEIYTLIVTGGIVLLVMILLVPGARAEAEPLLRVENRPFELPKPDLTLRTAGNAPAPRNPGSEVNLQEAAALCLDLSRVASTTDLRVLLARTATLLHARGIVLWVPGQSGELRPALSHGYPEATLARLPSIAATADNATAAAYRLGEVKEVPAGNSPTGAVIAPLLTAAGCGGVLAVELPAGAESHTAVQAIVTFIAAQLAGLVGSAPTETSTRSQTAGRSSA